MDPHPRTAEQPLNFELLAKHAEAQGNWQAAAGFYAQAIERRAAELALINSVQEGLSSKLDLQAIYNLVGDKLRDTFNAQVVMISQYDPQTHKIYHHYAIEREQHLHIQGWQPVDSSRGTIIRTRSPFIINLEEIVNVISAGKMQVVPGTELPKTWLGVPMLIGNQVKGIVSLQNLDKENAFSMADIDLLTALTNSMSLSLENARLFNESERLLNLLEAEMEIARQTQQSILPRQLPSYHGYDFGSLIFPSRAVGGDFYDFINLDDQHLCIVIGDVSGKGLPAALVMALTFSLVRAATGRTDNPRKIFNNVNSFLYNMSASGMFVTLLYSVLDIETGSLAYLRAGHPLPIILDKNGELVKIAMDKGQPLGLFSDFLIDQQRVTIPKGGLALLYSDGLNEASDSQGNELGFTRVKQELFTHREENARTICEQLWFAVQNHSGENLHQDDFTTVVVKREI